MVIIDRLKESQKDFFKSLKNNDEVKIKGYLSGYENSTYFENMLVASSVEKVA